MRKRAELRYNLVVKLAMVILFVLLSLVLLLNGCEDPAPPLNLNSAWQAYEAGRPDVARGLAVRAAEIGVTRDEDLGPLLELLVRTGEAPRAVMIYQSFEGVPGTASHDSWILALLVLGRLDDAEAAIVERHQARTMTARTHQMRGRLQMGRGRPEDARRALLESQRLDQEDPETWALLGRVFVVLRQIPRAQGLLREAWRKFPESMEVRKALSEVVLLGKPDDDASSRLLVDLLTPVARLRPQDLNARRNLGVCLRRLGRFRAAERIFTDLTKESRATAQDWQNLGVALAEQEEWEGAIEALERSTKMESGHEKVFLNLGNARLRLAESSLEAAFEITQAEKAFQRALVLNPQSVIARVGLGRAAVKRNPADDPQALGAAKFFEEAIGLDQNCFEAHLQLALLYYDVWMPAEKTRGDGYWRAKREFEAAAALSNPDQWTPGARQAWEEIRK